MRVLVCGSRKWVDEETMRKRIAELPGGTTIVHGDARGADRMAARISRDLLLVDEAHPADWSLHGKAAGPIRNQAMLDSGIDLALAFRVSGRSPGTDDMVHRVMRAGVPYEVHRCS